MEDESSRRIKKDQRHYVRMSAPIMLNIRYYHGYVIYQGAVTGSLGSSNGCPVRDVIEGVERAEKEWRKER